MDILLRWFFLLWQQVKKKVWQGECFVRIIFQHYFVKIWKEFVGIICSWTLFSSENSLLIHMCKKINLSEFVLLPLINIVNIKILEI